MSTPGIAPSAIWSRMVDDPIVQNATYRFNKADRAYIDSQILGLETLLLELVGGQLYFAVSQNVSAGGTIAATFPAGIGIVTLTGSPSGAYTLTLPAGQGQYTVVNTTGQTATVQIGSSTLQVLSGANSIVSTDGTTLYTQTLNNAPVASIAKSVSFTIASPSVNAIYAVSTSTVSVVATITGTPVDGVELGFVDITKLWPTHLFGFQCQGGAASRNPENLAASDTGSQINVGLVAGEMFVMKWYASSGLWIPR